MLLLSSPFLVLWSSHYLNLFFVTKHPFHLVSPSPWPLFSSISAFTFVCGLIFSWSRHGFYVLVLGSFLLLICFCFWSSNIILESTYQGLHTIRVQSGLRLGMSLFIVSELFFFVSFFWAYLHCSLSPNVEIGSSWPPLGLVSLDAFSIPLLNTFVLLTSGATVTMAHQSLRRDFFLSCVYSLGITVLLGLFFSFLQGAEYYFCSFCISDSSYGSCFYLATGFHGLHVIIGTLFLFTSFLRLISRHYSCTRHLGLEFACWYWHFVDVDRKSVV